MPDLRGIPRRSKCARKQTSSLCASSLRASSLGDQLLVGEEFVQRFSSSVSCRRSRGCRNLRLILLFRVCGCKNVQKATRTQIRLRAAQMYRLVNSSCCCSGRGGGFARFLHGLNHICGGAFVHSILVNARRKCLQICQRCAVKLQGEMVLVSKF